MTKISRLIFIAIAVSYGYGGLVHLANIAGFSGYNWLDAPPKWQVLDVVYLGLDFVVCVGLFRGWRSAATAFFVAGVSQIVLYTLGAHWVMDVPGEFLPSGHKMSLGSLVGFHLITLILMSYALWTRNSQTSAPEKTTN